MRRVLLGAFIMNLSMVAATAQEWSAPAGGVPVSSACASSPGPGTPLPFRLDALVAAALCSHPSMQADRHSIDASEKDIEAAESRWWPTFSAQLESGNNREDSLPSRYLRLEQTLWDGGAVKSEVKVAKRGQVLANVNLLRDGKTLEIQVIEAWAMAHNAVGRVKVGRDLLAKLTEHEEMMTRRVSAGLSAQIELEQVKAQLFQVQLDLRRANTSLTWAALKLSQLCVRTVSASDIMQAAELPVPEASEADMNMLLKENWTEAVERMYAVQSANAEVLVGRARIDSKKTQNIPQVYAKVDRTLGDKGDTYGYVGLRYTLGTGLPVNSEVAALVARVAAQESNRDGIRLEAQERILRDLEDVQEAAQRHKVLQSAVASSLRVYESYTRQFIAGRKSWLDVLNAIRDLSANQYALVDARTGYAGLMARLNSVLRQEALALEN